MNEHDLVCMPEHWIESNVFSRIHSSFGLRPKQRRGRLFGADPLLHDTHLSQQHRHRHHVQPHLYHHQPLLQPIHDLWPFNRAALRARLLPQIQRPHRPRWRAQRFRLRNILTTRAGRYGLRKQSLHLSQKIWLKSIFPAYLINLQIVLKLKGN